MLRIGLVAFVFGLGIAAGFADAQPVVVQEATPSDRVDTEVPSPRLSFEVYAAQAYDFRSDLDQVSGRVSVARTMGGFGVSYAPNDQWLLNGSVIGEYSNYDFSSGAGIVPGQTGDPFDDFYDVSALVRATRLFDNGYSLTLGGFVGASWEQDASVSDSITGGGLVGVGYRFTDNLRITLGAGVYSRLEDDASITPFIAVVWNITDTVTLQSEGLGLKLTSELNEQFTVGLMGQYHRREFRLNDDHDNVDIDDGVLRDARAEVSLFGEWNPTGRISVEGRAGVSVWQRYEVLDDGGSRVSRVNTDPGVFLALEVGISF